MRYLWLLCLAAVLSAADAPSLFYSREFAGVEPPYVEVTLERSGAAVYRETPDDPDENSVEFQLGSQETERIFSLAEKLDHLSRPLESGLKVANMGQKTLRWESDQETNEQVFNYSKIPAAQELAGIFSGITESVHHMQTLERAIRYDRLGVNDALLDIQVALDRNRLSGAEMLLTRLDEVSANERFVNIARKRAAEIAEIIRDQEAK